MKKFESMKSKIEKSNVFSKEMKKYLIVIYRQSDEYLREINELFVSMNKKLDYMQRAHRIQPKIQI